MIILGIETSCDETAAAVIESEPDNKGIILAQEVLSQIDSHSSFGGVVPEIAARAHLNTLDSIIKSVMEDACLSFHELNGIAVTSGPGLAGGLIVGTMIARTLAAVHNKPVFTINHLEGHALTARLTHRLSFPYLLLLVSGGHTQILLIKDVGDYECLATTIDDALGEAFDKTAKLLSLPYPGGPQVEKVALHGDPKAFDFPRPLQRHDTLNMSFSGLKTAVRKAFLEQSREKEDICASFQAAVGDILENRIKRAFNLFVERFGTNGTFVMAGGVATNLYLRHRLESTCRLASWNWIVPPKNLCTDNAAMIAWAAIERLQVGNKKNEDQGIRPRWPLDQKKQATYGSGRRGAKV
ncbi:tRNA (adenosine(37)-N6)-threonylcarbamoyltransferase complex transferase subunit TsaD [Candidatus Endowatersipora endosymbiont of Watersipora subatra]|uniref:tRNA (adenosine(37)-N6)-threonylcarbamoyltransferase complex transferase subunit TsaD n=1 Tax=Candidatus Endowatersipora endosymbiont of Watersipora subatra TaxID=3077946 RepID=UPI00312C8221